MPNTYITPKGVDVVAEVDGAIRRIIFPDMNQLEEVESSLARKKLPEGPWSPQMAERVALWQSGQPTVLNPGGQIRLGVGVLPIVKWKGYVVPIFGVFDFTHPTRGRRWTTPAGILESRNLLEDAYGELGEEIVPTVVVWDAEHRKVIGRKVGFWALNGELIRKQWVVDYAVHPTHNFEIDPKLVLPITPVKDLPGMVEFHFGNTVIHGLEAYEPETGSSELTIPVYAEVPDDFDAMDGEMVGNSYRESKPVMPVMTTKAFQAMNACFSSGIVNWTGNL